MYMLAVVNSGSSIRICIILGNPMISGHISKYHVVALLGFYILVNIMIPR
jgi:hypothetical protein